MLLSILGYSTGWVIAAVFAFGFFVVGLTYLAHLIAPAGGPPQYILDLEASQLLGGREAQAAEAAIEQLIEETPTVAPRGSSRERIDDEVMTAYNGYRAQCRNDRKQPLGLSRWLYNFDPDLYHRVFSDLD